MERIGSGVQRELRRFSPAGGMPEILEVWPGAVGPEIVANAWPARIGRDGTLHVNASSSTWAFELGQLAPKISERLREKLGESAPKALRFSVGHLPEAGPPEPADTSAEVAQASPEDVKKGAELASAIDGVELREAVARAASLSLARAASDRHF
jgi:predicted nucleic acid-binding Zn ribbon protein